MDRSAATAMAAEQQVHSETARLTRIDQRGWIDMNGLTRSDGTSQFQPQHYHTNTLLLLLLLLLYIAIYYYIVMYYSAVRP